MIVWGGENAFLENTGGRYDPSTDSWTSTSTAGAPCERRLHTAVWTGSEMIVWGGGSSDLSAWYTGGRYNPATDSWIETRRPVGPMGRRGQTGVWTGNEMIVWGGMYDDVNLIQNSNDCNLAHLIAAETFLHQRTRAPSSLKGFAFRSIAML